MRLVCYHGNERVLRVACGKVGECEECMEAWRSRVRRRVRNGARMPRFGLWFLTLTFADPVTLDSAMASWRTFRRSLMREFPRARLFRVVELTKTGRPHFHAVVDADLPRIYKADKGGESLESYWAKQSDRARDFLLRHVLPAGFGPISDCERVRRGPGGAASYMGKYLSKANSKKSGTRQWSSGARG